MFAKVHGCESRSCQRCPVRRAARLIVVAPSEVPGDCPHRLVGRLGRCLVGDRMSLFDVGLTPDARHVLPTIWTTAHLHRAIETGRLVALRRPFVPTPIGVEPKPFEKAAQEPPPPAEEVDTWLDIRLLDADGEPVAGAPYRVTLPDGSKRHGFLNYLGRVRVENITRRGECQVEFPALDEKDWQPGEPPAETKELTWIEIVTRTEADEALPFTPYKLECADGMVLHGWTKDDGAAKRDDVPKGKVEITLPNVDEKDWSPNPPTP
ncbi:hypothetical protein RAS1_19150 [Phycisphaerae bacterium RAS1]|nr:hypothetical protein RAS1_19150 [Phycisphaerae bacterium RAS1]